ncbi:MAG: NifB/NifX family molybdenum-iron cluster-binding protein [Methanothrix sp.]|nr:NifB/NifX family molybdenum-iron cluster-binding protein [Methanothrix sp.]
MKVCITAGASGLDAPMDPRFGRCPFFVVVDLDSMSENSISNSNVTASSGAGIQAAQEVARQGVSALITGNIGPNAMQTLSAAKIEVYQHLGTGSVRDVLEKFKQGELTKISSASVPVHAGMGGQGRGPVGQGRGRGGGGRGSGAGSGGGQGAGSGSGVGGGRGQGTGRGGQEQ